MAPPVQTPEQRAEALRKAADARNARTKALNEVRSGNVTLAEVLADDESPLQRAFVRQLLLALPGVGKVSAAKAMDGIGIDERRRVRGLGERQRGELARLFATASA